jgi:hypothetical protein
MKGARRDTLKHKRSMVDYMTRVWDLEVLVLSHIYIYKDFWQKCL